MTAISSTRTSVVAKPKHNRAAWREEMLGQFLEQMREHSLPEEVTTARGKQVNAAFKGQYIDVYM
jgi:hypothetical protein